MDARTKVLQLVDDELIDKDELILSLLSYMTNQEVSDCMEANEYELDPQE